MTVRALPIPIGWMVFWFMPIIMVGVQTAMALDFSAERIVKNGKSVVTAHVNAKDDRWRFEFSQPQRGASVIIVRADLGTAWLILSRRRQYLAEPITSDLRLTMSEKMEGEIFREFVGDETLNGYSTELFEITVAGNEQTHQYYRWVTKTESPRYARSIGVPGSP